MIAVINAQAQAAMSTVSFIKEVGFKKIATSGQQDPEQGSETGEPIYVTFKYLKETSPFTPAVPAAVTGVNITAPGTGYTSAPAVSFAGGGGSGAAATASINAAAGTVTGVTITIPGSGYTAAPTVAFTGGGGAGATAVATFIPAVPAVPAVVETRMIEVPILTLVPIPCLRIEEVTIDFNAKINSVEYHKIDTSLKIDGNLAVRQRWPSGSAKLNVAVAYQRNTQQGTTVERTFSLAIHIKIVQDEMPGGMEKVLGILEDAIKSQAV